MIGINISLYQKNSASVKVLDVYSNAEAAYSLNKIRTAYSGFCIRAEKADGATLDIGFVGDDLDTVSLLAFAASGDVKVRIWYDQSAVGLNVSQTTYSKMPVIVEAGVLVTYNNKPTLKFVAANSTQLTAPFVNNVSTYSIFSVHAKVTAGAVYSIVKSGTSDYAMLFSNGNMLFRHNGGTAITLSPYPLLQNISSTIYGSLLTTFHYNESLVGSLAGVNSTVPAGTLYIGSRNTTNLLTGLVQSVIVYNTNQSANRVDIETALEKIYSQDFGFQLKTFYLPDSDGNEVGITGFTNTGLFVDEDATALRSDGKINVWMSNWGGGAVKLKQSMVNMLIDPNAANLSTAELIADVPIWNSINPPNGGIQGIVLDNAGTLWVSGLRNYTKTGTFIRKLSCMDALGGAIAGLAYDKNTNQLIVSGTGATGTIYFVDIDTDSVASSFAYTGLIDQIYYDSNLNSIYATPLKVFSRTGTVLTTPSITLSRSPEVEGIGKINNLLFLINSDAGYHSSGDVSNPPYSNKNTATIYRFF